MAIRRHRTEKYSAAFRNGTHAQPPAPGDRAGQASRRQTANHRAGTSDWRNDPIANLEIWLIVQVPRVSLQLKAFRQPKGLIIMDEGLYETIITEKLRHDLDDLANQGLTSESEDVDAGESHQPLAQFLYHLIRLGLATRGGDAEEKLRRQADLANNLIRVLQNADPEAFQGEFVPQEVKRLLAVHRVQLRPPTRSQTPLAQGCLLTNTQDDPALYNELLKEFGSCDRVDILCSFIKWSGIQLLDPGLKSFSNADRSGLRVISTVYMGATDARAIEYLAGLPKSQVKMSYDGHQTRLHAKAYIFHRGTGYGTAYVGSSNVSHSAMTEGHEWNVKISQFESPHLWKKITATFETNWNGPDYLPYQPGRQNEPGDSAKLRDALDRQQSPSAERKASTFFDLQPWPFQQEILETLAAERTVQGRDRHLVVAATGTGKTMIAAFDYKQWIDQLGLPSGSRPRLLFLAHRKEILEQSVATYRAVLRDSDFGELVVDGNRAAEGNHVFASVQSWHSQNYESFPPTYFDYVVIDEFHHAEASTYRKILDHIRPRVLLGLTATPERGDSLDVLRYFNGHLSAAVRLPEAINRGLLCPFHYFGISDIVDLRKITWTRGGYDVSELSLAYTNNRDRSRLVIDKVSQKLLDASRVRGLGFCVSVDHAKFMADEFNQQGLSSIAITGDSERGDREDALKRLRKREVNFIFTVDLYNEGIDLPEIDTVLFLRPTESLTVFLQQLGRGLRKHPDKPFLTVLDFIGQQNQKFRFDLRYRPLLGEGNASVKDQLENGFSSVPAGCAIQFEKDAQALILENIRQTLRTIRPAMIQNLKDIAAKLGRRPTLTEFVELTEISAEELYRKGGSYYQLCNDAGKLEGMMSETEILLNNRLSRLADFDDVNMIDSLHRLLSGVPGSAEAGEIDETTQRRLLMLHFALRIPSFSPSSALEILRFLRENRLLRDEMFELLSYNRTQIRVRQVGCDVPFLCPLNLFARYSREQMFAALGHWDIVHQPPNREGVVYLPRIKADLLMVTLKKTSKHYSPSTMYDDYAISHDLFHWQSQSTTSAESPTGRRYLSRGRDGHTFLLAVRETNERSNTTMPYYFLGPVDYVEHRGSRPISITWRLRHGLPAHLARFMVRLAAV